MWNIALWSDILSKIIPGLWLVDTFNLFVGIWSIKAAVFLVTRVGFNISGKKVYVYNISRNVNFGLKARKKLNKHVLLNLYYSICLSIFHFCNHVWGNIYPTNLKNITVLQIKNIRIVTCSPYRAHSRPLLVANNVLSVSEINVYMVGILMYNYCNDNMPDIFNGFFQRNSERHNRNTRQSNDFHVRFARLDVRKFSLRIHGATIWNDIPLYIKNASSLNVFKQMLRKHLIDMNVHGFVTQFQ